MLEEVCKNFKGRINLMRIFIDNASPLSLTELKEIYEDLGGEYRLFVYKNNFHIIGILLLSDMDFYQEYILSFFTSLKKQKNLAYSISEKYKNKGYGTQMLKDFVSFSKEKKLSYFVLIEGENIASIKVLKKSGLNYQEKTSENEQYYCGYPLNI